MFNGKELRKQDGSKVDAKQVIDDSNIIAVYFSAHWCPPCRQFTPILKDFFDEEDVKAAGLSIIFVSSDRNAEEMNSYFTEHHGDYYAVPFEDPELTKTLKTSCGVSGIPMLCVISKEGKPLLKEGRGDLQGSTSPKQVVEKWKALY